MPPRLLETIKGEILLLKTAYRREGLGYVLRKGTIYAVSWPINILIAFYYRHLKHPRLSFTFQGQTYNYFYHSYNNTWQNERAIEIPIIWRLLQEYRDKKILEVGNVLRHYFPCRHDVVDLNEEYPGVVNKDISDFRPAKKYDLVISISTFEHIGWDEKPKKPKKLLTAIKNLTKNVIAPSGRLIMTVPLGYNTAMDKFLVDGKINFTNISCFRRFSLQSNEWEEARWDEIRDKEFSTDGRWCGKNRVLIIGDIQTGTSSS